jgi:hypothetical protein
MKPKTKELSCLMKLKFDMVTKLRLLVYNMRMTRLLKGSIKMLVLNSKVGFSIVILTVSEKIESKVLR